MVGSLLGIVMAKKLPFVKYAYVDDSQRSEVDTFIKTMQPTAYTDVEMKKSNVTANLT